MATQHPGRATRVTAVEPAVATRSSPDDQTLIAGCLQGDHRAWVMLVERYERLIYSIPLRYGLTESEAADIFQDVCLILLQKLESLRDETRLSAWLVTVARRECWKIMRRHDLAGAADQMPLLIEQATDEVEPDEAIVQWEAAQAVREALGQLGEPCRSLLRQLYYKQPAPSYAAVAEALGMAEGSIGPTRARCLKKLFHLMGGARYRAGK